VKADRQTQTYRNDDRNTSHPCGGRRNKSYFVVEIRQSLAYIVNKAIRAPATVESYMLLSSAIFFSYTLSMGYTLAHVYHTQDNARCRAVSCVALRCGAGSGVNAALGWY